ncbi:MAG: hypothetical protein ACRDMA_15970 [Solirubrobacterales bacterium]
MAASARFIAAVRPATLVAGGVFAVHELSYHAGFGADAAATLQGHSYLAALLPALAALVALTLVVTVEGGVAGTRARRASPLSRIVAYAGAILALFCVQEAVEGLLAGGDPVRIGVALVSGGFVAAPLSLGFGFVAWLAVRGLEAVEERIAIRFERPASPGSARFGLRPRWLDVLLSPTLLAGGAAARAPPSV